MIVGYLVNKYPLNSHSFIRREIQAVEMLGLQVRRYSVRPVTQALASDADLKEAERTRVILETGLAGHLWAVVAALGRPLRFLRATKLAVQLGWRSDRGLLRHVVYLAEACVLLRWLRRDDVEHLHAHFGTNPAAVAVLCRELGGPPCSFTVHGPEEFDRPESLHLDKKIERSAFVVAISSFGRAQLWRWTAYEHWDKVHVVHCGVGEDFLRAPATPVPSDPRLICVARLHEQKGHPLLIEAAARLAAEGLRFEVVLAGDGPLRPQVEELIRRLGLEDRVRLAGWMSDVQVRDTILSSRALVLPSFAEGLPVVVMEALALGRPVITTSIAGIPELVGHGTTGWLIPAGSVEALVEAMRAALQASPGHLEDMGRAGAALVVANHDAAREARKLVDLFRAIAERTHPAPSSPALETATGERNRPA